MAKDTFHENAKKALQNDGWTITDELWRTVVGKVKVEVDLIAEKIIIAEKAERKIAVEVKSFISPSPVTDFEEAYGVFMLYRRVLRKLKPDWTLYLAVRQVTFDTFLQRPLVQEIVEDEQINLLVLKKKKIASSHGKIGAIPKVDSRNSGRTNQSKFLDVNRHRGAIVD